MAVPQLKARWHDRDGQLLADKVITRLNHGESLDGLGLGEHEGRIDLRHFWLGALAAVVTGRSISGLDLTHSLTRIDLDNATMSNCVIDSVDWAGWTVRSSRVGECSFDRADLGDARLDAGNRGATRHNQPSSYLRCDFTRTKFGGATDWGHAELGECQFIDTRFAHTDDWLIELGLASLIRCRFDGDYRGLTFDAAPPGYRYAVPVVDEVDLSNADVPGLEFSGRDNSTCQFPQDTRHIVVRDWPGVAELAVADAALPESFKRAWLSDPVRRSPVQVFHHEPLTEVCGADTDAVVSWLRRYETAPDTASGKRSVGRSRWRIRRRGRGPAETGP